MASHATKKAGWYLPRRWLMASPSNWCCHAHSKKPNCQQQSSGLHLLPEDFLMAKYGPKAQRKVEKTMHEYKEGDLKSGSGKKVTSRKQAVAIGLSEARKAGGKVPKKK